LEFLDATPITVTGGGTVPNINFTLTPGGTITGTVTNAANGNPITNVNVTAVVLIGTQAVTVDTVATNSTGAYSISLLPEGRVYLYTGNTQGFVNEIYDNIPCIGLCSGSTATTGTAVQV
jgi:hypothetical protein